MTTKNAFRALSKRVRIGKHVNDFCVVCVVVFMFFYVHEVQ
jgi:hypothetical protein